MAYVAGNSNFIFGISIVNLAPSSIWVVSLSKGEPEQVRESQYMNMSPVWTPDGKHLLFISDQDGSRDVFQIALGKSGKPLGEPSRLTTGLDAHTIDISNDGEFLAYSKFRHSSNIWSIRIPEEGPVSDSEAQPVTTGSQVIEGLHVSKDGQWLAYDSNRSGKNQDIYKIPITGGEPVQLSTHPSNDYYPAWSADGKQIAFYSLRAGNRDIYVMSADGGSIQQITADPADDFQPDWSPDGRQIVFYSNKTGREELYTVSQVIEKFGWSIPKQLTFDGGQHARWSRDGRFIAYTSGGKIVVISPEDGDTRVVFGNKDPEKFPYPLYLDWSPDGQTIYYKAFDSKRRSTFWSISVSGGTPKLLVQFDNPYRKFSRTEFTTDGKRFFFTLTENDSDIWLAELLTDK